MRIAIHEVKTEKFDLKQKQKEDDMRLQRVFKEQKIYNELKQNLATTKKRN